MSAAPDAAALPWAVPIPGGSVLCGHQDPGPGGPSESHRAGADTGMLRPHLGTAIRAEFSWGKAAGRACNSKQRPRALPETTTVVPPATHRALAQLVLALEGEPRASGKLALPARGGAGLRCAAPETPVTVAGGGAAAPIRARASATLPVTAFAPSVQTPTQKRQTTASECYRERGFDLWLP